MVTVEEPPLAIHTIPLYLFKPFPSISTFFMHVLLHPILPSYSWLSSTTMSHFLHKPFLLHYYAMIRIFFFLFSLLYFFSLFFLTTFLW